MEGRIHNSIGRLRIILDRLTQYAGLPFEFGYRSLCQDLLIILLELIISIRIAYGSDDPAGTGILFNK